MYLYIYIFQIYIHTLKPLRKQQLFFGMSEHLANMNYTESQKRSKGCSNTRKGYAEWTEEFGV